MADIKPAEISAILREQLAGLKTETELQEVGTVLQEVGTVLQIGDGIARIYGLSNVQSGELIEFENGVQGIALNLEEDNVGAVLLGPSGELKEGASVKRTGTIAYSSRRRNAWSCCKHTGRAYRWKWSYHRRVV